MYQVPRELIIMGETDYHLSPDFVQRLCASLQHETGIHLRTPSKASIPPTEVPTSLLALARAFMKASTCRHRGHNFLLPSA